jgi:hypothetical protein
VGHGELELGRLGHDRRVGPQRAQDLLHAEARVLLVGDRGHDDVAAQPERRRVAARDERRGEAALHVVRPAPVEAVAVGAWVVRRRHPGDADRVEVPAEQQRAPAAEPGARTTTLGRPAWPPGPRPRGPRRPPTR